jgi:choline dehydrogenase-like flavoprotein
MTLSPPVLDVLIVGSGPAGVQSAAELTARGLRVGLLDIGVTDKRWAACIPDCSFSEIRRTDENQSDYFLGDPRDMLKKLVRAGAHLTPPRQYMIRDMDQLLPLESESFAPLQATSAGGLGVSWGAQVFTLTDAELRRVGLPPAEMRQWQAKVSEHIGVSGSDDECGRAIADLPNLQPPHRLDTNAESILRHYKRQSARMKNRGFYMAPAALAMLSRPIGDRSANLYRDMDYYSDAGGSVYRPQHTLGELQRRENFVYLSGRLATRFEEPAPGNGVSLRCRVLDDGSEQRISARRLILAAGTINSGRIALQSIATPSRELGILCNPNHWIVAINLCMLGRDAADRRHSLAQLAAVMRTSDDPDDFVAAQFFSYRSLLIYRILRDIPLPPRLGVLFVRLVLNALTCINVHFPDAPARSKRIGFKHERADALTARYELPPQQVASIRRDERALLRLLRAIGCIPLTVMRPPAGASIHYAGTLPFSDDRAPLTCEPTGRLRGAANVYVADSSTWRFLPAKGLTFTLMANARRVAAAVASSLGT